MSGFLFKDVSIFTISCNSYPFSLQYKEVSGSLPINSLHCKLIFKDIADHLKSIFVMKKATIVLFFSVVMTSYYGQGIDQTRLDSLLKKSEEAHSEAVIIYEDDQLVAEKYFGIGQAGNKIESISCTKSIVGLAVACMLTDKPIQSLDTPIADYYPEWKQGQKKLITIRHLVNMTSGIQNDTNASVEIYPSNDFVQLALAAELSKKPGESWEYNNKSLNLTAGVIQKTTGKRMDDYIGEIFFKPLNIPYLDLG